MGMKHNLPERIQRLIVFNNHPDATCSIPLSSDDKIKILNIWAKVLKPLKAKDNGGKKVHVAIYSNAEVLYCESIKITRQGA